MNAKVIFDKYKDLPVEIKKFFQEDNIDVTLNKEYIIYAVSNWNNNFFFLVRSDSDFPEWIHSRVFSVNDKTIPKDWICNFQSNELQMILGPEFIAKDKEAYNSMVQAESEQIKLFWERVKVDE